MKNKNLSIVSIFPLLPSFYEPFYEFARYPIQSIRPQDGKYMITYNDDIYILDYFVYKMRQIMEIPNNTMDILRNGKEGGHSSLILCERNHPEFYNLFKDKNINFID